MWIYTERKEERCELLGQEQVTEVSMVTEQQIHAIDSTCFLNGKAYQLKNYIL